MAALQTYLVISHTPIVVEELDGTATSYPPGAVFSANPQLPSILRLLSIGSIIPTTQLPPSPSGGGGGSGPTGSPGPPGPPGPPGINWKGGWSAIESYVVDDAVEFGGASYVAVVGNIGVPPPAPQWDVFAAGGAGSPGPPGPPGPSGPAGPIGINWSGAWSAFTSYATNDGVQFGGSSYIALSPSTGSMPPSANWDLIAQVGSVGPSGGPGPSGPSGPTGPAGITWQGGWSALASYVAGDGVQYNGSSYIAISPNVGDPPPSLNWDLLAQIGAAGPTGSGGPTGPPGPTGPTGSTGVVWRGAWSFVLSYAIDDVVIFLNDGNTYIAVAANSGVTPPSTGIWEIFTQHGSQGAQGVQGPTGGATGAQGIMGNTGNAGPAGATSNAGYRQTQVVPTNTAGSQSFLVSTASTPIATDRVYMIINTAEYRQPLHISVSIVVGVSFTVTWLGAFDLTSVDDAIIAWFTTPP